MKRLHLLWATMCLSAAVVTAHGDAHACGGCFHQEGPVEGQDPMQGDQVSLVTSHVMALSISASQTVLWDQVEFAGSPEDFAWVLPVRPGAYLEVASDAFMETLRAATNPRVSPPALACDDFDGCATASAARAVPPTAAFACSADDGVGAEGDGTFDGNQEPDPVTVIHEGSAGPYETVTLRSEEPGVLTTWLQEHGYAIASDVQPIIDDYQDEGYDFIALRLAPQQGVQQMKPVRVVMPGVVVSLPLRMVAAGTGANVALTLFVIGEGRWNVANFPKAEVDHDDLSWDFTSASSNYDQIRNQLWSQDAGRTWVTSYAYPNTLLSPSANPVTGELVTYVTASRASTTIAAAFAQQGLNNGETDDVLGCSEAFGRLRESERTVAPPCDDITCEIPDNFIDAAELSCGELDDLAVALTGMRPRDVWLTRLDANLPRAALADDLVLEADVGQSLALHWAVPDRASNAPCPLAGGFKPAERRGGAWLGVLLMLGLALGGVARRMARDREAA